MSTSNKVPPRAVNPTKANLPTAPKAKAPASQAHQGKSHGLINIAAPHARISPVVRQNFSQGPKRAVFGRVGVNTIIDSVQQEDSGEGDARVRVKRTYIRTYIHVYKGPAENRPELCRSIVTVVQPSESLL